MTRHPLEYAMSGYMGIGHPRQNPGLMASKFPCVNNHPRPALFPCGNGAVAGMPFICGYTAPILLSRKQTGNALRDPD
jgi:hypothetical protein